MKVLIADDDRDAGESLAELLELRAHECVVVRSGERAIEVSESAGFDAILMDLKMPGISGREACQAILRRDPAARLIVITGNCVEEELDLVRRLPIVRVLRKPFNSRELERALAECVDRQEPR